VAEDLTIQGFSLWSSGDAIVIRPTDHSANYSLRLYDMTGRLLCVKEHLRGRQQVYVPEHRKLLIVKLISEKGISIGTFKLMHNLSK
jgi:hypothetical protein